MIKILAGDESISTGNFGCYCPYYYVDETTGQVLISDRAEEIINTIPQEHRIIDPITCLEIMCFNYPLGDRTLIQGLRRMPWHASLYGNGEVKRRRPLPHAHKLSDPAEIARALRRCLEEELAGYIKGHQRCWVLLSGGLDSRVTAGVLKTLEPRIATEIVAVTWGVEGSRDVVFAQRIAKKYGWDWHHISYEETTIWDNLQLSAQWGGEVAGIHLHGMHTLGGMVDSKDVVIASSWGDSIGRGEYSGQHISRMNMPPVSNKHWLIHRSIADECIRGALEDRKLAWSCEPDQSFHVICELDAQENYMRRLIGHAMDYIRQFCDLEQAFTSDNTVTTMWSFSPYCRQAEVYFLLLKELDEFLFDLPWARTGVAPSGSSENDKSLNPLYHNWGRWLRTTRVTEIKRILFDGGLGDLGIFNMSQVRQCFRMWLKEPTDIVGMTEDILKLATFEFFRSRYSMKCSKDRTSMLDRTVAILYPFAKKMYHRFAAQ